ncbi:MAG: PGPGW domain-containing protein [Candidatus Pacebacteria bacterium]|nr:PGPGW domain-containing protein [Candidatus Paceibacterota bacterium]
MLEETVKITYKVARRIVVAVVGSTVVLVGIALLFLPGPAFIVIPMGIGILAIEFAWARRWLRTLRNSAGNAWNSVTGNNRNMAENDER